MSAPILTDAQVIDAINASLQVATMALYSCGCGETLPGVREVNDVEECGDCGEYVAIVQAFPILDI
jgi:predicted SprT family Zn-dependent metalloprotease